MVVCIEHSRFKKGVCAACGICKKCTPPESCSDKENHIVQCQGIKRNVTPSEKILCPRRGTRPSSGRGKNRIKHINGEEEDFDINCPEKISNSGENRKSKLIAICKILGIDPGIRSCPNDGFTNLSADHSCQRSYRARKIVVAINESICDLVCPSNEQFKNFCMRPKVVPDSSLEKLKTNISDLIFLAKREVRIVAQAILATSFKRECIQNILETEAQRFEGESNAKALMGRVHFTSLRKVFQVLRSGKEIPKCVYSYRIDSIKLATTVNFIQGSLLVKPGVVRDVRIGGHVFKHLPDTREEVRASTP